MSNDETYIRRALELAERATAGTNPNPLVGAVIVRDGEIVGEGYHGGPGRPHAEIEAILDAGERASGATLYVNLEPCCHYGRTPPCTEAIIDAGISRVVFSMYDPFGEVRGKGAGALRSRGIDVTVGPCAYDALELNLPYVHRIVSGSPFIVLKLAATLDGRITMDGRKHITGLESRRRVHVLRSRLEAIAVGKGTIDLDDPVLDRRLLDPGLPPPVRMIFDSGLSFPHDHAWLTQGDPVIIYCGEGASPERRELLSGAGADVVTLPGKDGLVNLHDWVEDVGRRGFSSVLVEGGVAIATSMMLGGIIDRLVLFVAPVVAGAGGESWYRDPGLPVWLEDGELAPTRVEVIEGDVMVVYDRFHVRSYLGAVTEEGELVHRSR